jgi:aldehyde dehydrogenase (NAD+)
VSLCVFRAPSGTSTGLNHFSNGEILESYSPVDGQLIAKVKTTTAADYEKVMESATAAFKALELYQHRNVGNIHNLEKLHVNKEALVN